MLTTAIIPAFGRLRQGNQGFKASMRIRPCGVRELRGKREEGRRQERKRMSEEEEEWAGLKATHTACTALTRGKVCRKHRLKALEE